MNTLSRMTSPKVFKRPVPEFFSTEPAKKCRIQSSKENIPPKSSTLEILEENGISNAEECPVKSTPKKCKRYDEEPVTPNTNIKLLTSLAATLDYAHCHTPTTRNSSLTSIVTHDEEAFDNNACRMNRKEKSLAIICTRFLKMYPLYPENGSNIIVSLDDACYKLGVERRRLYDIVNVFESIDMLRKLAKNKYLWFGKINLLKALRNIKIAAENENVLSKLQYVLRLESGLESRPSCILEEVKDFNKNFENQNSSFLTPNAIFQLSPVPELRKDKSLAIMSQKFLMLFLVSPSKIISLGVAAKVLNGFQKTERAAQIKTQIRRLYDIANVLSSIGLIQKEVTIGQNGRKPAFKYIGPDLDILDELGRAHIKLLNSNNIHSNRKSRSLTRHSSFQEICAVAEIEHQKLCLHENPNSAPPFEKSLLNSHKSITKTTFFNLNLNRSNGNENIKADLLTNNNTKEIRKDSDCSMFQKIQPKPTDVVKNTCLKPVTLPGQTNIRLINVPKQMLPTNGTYFLLNPTNNDVLKPANSMGTLLLVGPLSSVISTEATESKAPVEEKSAFKAMDLTELQDNAVEQLLNMSRYDGKTAEEKGTSKSPTFNKSPRRNLLKIIQKTEASNMMTDQSNSIRPISKDVSINDGESNESSGVSSTRNNSPGSAIWSNSPLSIPSGYTTPTPTALCDFSFPSNSETDSVLKNIENQSRYPESGCNVENQKGNGPYKENVNKNATGIDKPNLRATIIFPKKETQLLLGKDRPLRDIHSMLVPNSTSSNDSLNLEVSEIFKGHNLDEDAPKIPGSLKPFLIDEKTILSPIKNEMEKVKPTVSPSPFITPPYVVSDRIFVFNNSTLNGQSRGINTH